MNSDSPDYVVRSAEGFAPPRPVGNAPEAIAELVTRVREMSADQALPWDTWEILDPPSREQFGTLKQMVLALQGRVAALELQPNINPGGRNVIVGYGKDTTYVRKGRSIYRLQDDYPPVVIATWDPGDGAEPNGWSMWQVEEDKSRRGEYDFF